MSPHSDTLYQFRARQSLLLLLNVCVLSEPVANTNFIVTGLNQSNLDLNPQITHLRQACWPLQHHCGWHNYAIVINCSKKSNICVSLFFFFLLHINTHFHMSHIYDCQQLQTFYRWEIISIPKHPTVYTLKQKIYNPILQNIKWNQGYIPYVMVQKLI